MYPSKLRSGIPSRQSGIIGEAEARIGCRYENIDVVTLNQDH
jgi:hypothetical protein